MSYTTEKLDYIFSRGTIIRDPNFPPHRYRKDAYGNIMMRCKYGKDTDRGWAVDHVIPVSHGGSNLPRNLQPMNYAKNRELGDTLNKRKLPERWLER